MCFRTVHGKDEEDPGFFLPWRRGLSLSYISEWASAPVLIAKKDGQVQWCLDYWRLNNVTRKDVFQLPLIDECLDTLSGNV